MAQGRSATVGLSSADIDALSAIAEFEAGNQGRVGQAAVIDVILNRTAAGRRSRISDHPRTVREVIKQDKAFSALTGPQRSRPSITHGIRDLDARLDAMIARTSPTVRNNVLGHLAGRVNGMPSVVGPAVNYANPAHVDPHNYRGWVKDIVEAVRLGIPGFVQIGQHVFGTTPWDPPAPDFFTISPDPAAIKALAAIGEPPINPRPRPDPFGIAPTPRARPEFQPLDRASIAAPALARAAAGARDMEAPPIGASMRFQSSRPSSPAFSAIDAMRSGVPAPDLSRALDPSISPSRGLAAQLGSNLRSTPEVVGGYIGDPHSDLDVWGTEPLDVARAVLEGKYGGLFDAPPLEPANFGTPPAPDLSQVGPSRTGTGFFGSPELASVRPEGMAPAQVARDTRSLGSIEAGLPDFSPAPAIESAPQPAQAVSLPTRTGSGFVGSPELPGQITPAGRVAQAMDVAKTAPVEQIPTSLIDSFRTPAPDLIAAPPVPRARPDVPAPAITNTVLEKKPDRLSPSTPHKGLKSPLDKKDLSRAVTGIALAGPLGAITAPVLGRVIGSVRNAIAPASVVTSPQPGVTNAYQAAPPLGIGRLFGGGINLGGPSPANRASQDAFDAAIGRGASRAQANYEAWDAFYSMPGGGYEPNIAQESLRAARRSGMGSGGLSAADAARDQADSSGSSGGGTVLCSYFERLGWIPRHIWRGTTLWSLNNVDARTYRAYRWWADPLSRAMDRHPWLRKPVFHLIVRPWAYEAAFRAGRHRETSLLRRVHMAAFLATNRALGAVLFGRRRAAELAGSEA